MYDLWNTLAARAGRELTTPQHDLLSRYLDLLLAANQTMNLTGIVERSAAEVHHVADALTLLPFIPAEAVSIADVGAGGGVPGIPLAIALPACNVLLIESTKKKAAFLQRAVAELGLTNVRVSDERAEDVGIGGRRQSFDVVVARAVATMGWLAEWCLPLAKNGGKMLAMKGKRGPDELAAALHAIRLLGGGDAATHPIELPGTDSHVVIEIPKIARTPSKYPRPATIAKGNALA